MLLYTYGSKFNMHSPKTISIPILLIINHFSVNASVLSSHSNHKQQELSSHLRKNNILMHEHSLNQDSMKYERIVGQRDNISTDSFQKRNLKDTKKKANIFEKRTFTLAPTSSPRAEPFNAVSNGKGDTNSSFSNKGKGLQKTGKLNGSTILNKDNGCKGGKNGKDHKSCSPISRQTVNPSSMQMTNSNSRPTANPSSSSKLEKVKGSSTLKQGKGCKSDKRGKGSTNCVPTVDVKIKKSGKRKGCNKEKGGKENKNCAPSFSPTTTYSPSISSRPSTTPSLSSSPSISAHPTSPPSTSAEPTESLHPTHLPSQSFIPTISPIPSSSPTKSFSPTKISQSTVTEILNPSPIMLSEECEELLKGEILTTDNSLDVLFNYELLLDIKAVLSEVLPVLEKKIADEVSPKLLECSLGRRNLMSASGIVGVSPKEEDKKISEDDCQYMKADIDEKCYVMSGSMTAYLTDDKTVANEEKAEQELRSAVRDGMEDDLFINTTIGIWDLIYIGDSSGGSFTPGTPDGSDQNQKFVEKNTMTALGISLITMFALIAIIAAILVARKKRRYTITELKQSKNGNLLDDISYSGYDVEGDTFNLSDDDTAPDSVSSNDDQPKKFRILEDENSPGLSPAFHRSILDDLQFHESLSETKRKLSSSLMDKAVEESNAGEGILDDVTKSQLAKNVHSCTSATCEICISSEKQVEFEGIGTPPKLKRVEYQIGSQRNVVMQKNDDDTVDL